VCGPVGLEDVRRLEEMVSEETPVLQSFSDDFRELSAGYMEQFAGAEPFERYIGARVDEMDFILALQDAVLSLNFIDRRTDQVEYALEQAQSADRYRFDGESVLTGREALNSLKSGKADMEVVEEDMDEVVEALSESEAIPIDPKRARDGFYYQLDGPLMKMDDFEEPREAYWPFNEPGA
jgi:hypothetical protein